MQTMRQTFNLIIQTVVAETSHVGRKVKFETWIL